MRIAPVVLIIETLLVTQILVCRIIIIILLPPIRQLLLSDVNLLPLHPIFGQLILLRRQLIVLC